MIILPLERKEYYNDRTIGRFWLPNNYPSYFTLEDKDRQRLDDGTIIPWSSDLKIYGKTAISRGEYPLELDWSPKRTGLVPYIRNVPDFTAVQIHIANDPEDLEGCIGIGKNYDSDRKRIIHSTKACSEFYPLLYKLLIENKGEIRIKIS